MKKIKDFWKKNQINKVIVLMTILLISWIVVKIVTSTGASLDDNPNGKNEPKKIVVEVVDLTTKTTAEIDIWCNEKNLICNKLEDYSNVIAKGEIINQSIEAGRSIYEGDEINIFYSLGKKPSIEYLNALSKAEIYSSTMNMSKAAIYDQLISKYGEQFTKDAAKYAIDNIVADWSANALAKAKLYQETMSMSKAAIYDQLISKYGEQFTKEQARYAIDHLQD